MTGRYLIYTPVESVRDERRFNANWHTFTEVCRSLHRDGLDYSVQLNMTGDKPHALIAASGTAMPRKRAVAHAFSLPTPVTVPRCRERAVEVEWFLPENRERRNDYTTYWRHRQARYQELSGMTEEILRAELEYWHELETLSGLRKPGQKDEERFGDGEVAA